MQHKSVQLFHHTPKPTILLLVPQKNGSLIVNDDFNDATLRAEVEQVIESQESREFNIRKNSRALALEEGIKRYAEVYKELLA